MPAGCPRHPVFDRACEDFRCQRMWDVPGAPTPDEQLRRWALGDAVCPNSKHECCPDFSCCNPKLGWPMERRQKFIEADQGTREKMMMGAFGVLVESVDKKAYVTRGDPSDCK